MSHLYHVTYDEYVEISKHSIRNKKEILNSNIVCCYYCKTIYNACDQYSYINDGDEDTALCIKCGVDSIIGDASTYPISDRNFISHIHFYAFPNKDTIHPCLLREN